MWLLRSCRARSLESGAGPEQLWFLLSGHKDYAEAQGRALMAALRQDADLDKYVWRLVLSPVTDQWNNAVILAEWLALDKPSPVSTDYDSNHWIDGDWRHTDRAKVSLVEPDIDLLNPRSLPQQL